MGKGLTTYEGGVLFSRDPDLHAELQGTASRVLRPGLLWNARRVLELLGYAVAYNPALLPLAYGRPLRRGLDRGDEIAAVGDAFTLDDIPLHRMDPLRLRVAANALERLPAFLEAGRDRAVRRAGMLERAGAEVLRDDPGGEGVWPFFMVLMPDRDRRDPGRSARCGGRGSGFPSCSSGPCRTIRIWRVPSRAGHARRRGIWRAGC